MSLSPQQQTSIKEFRKRVGSKIPVEMNSDFELLRWIEARKFNIDKAENMLLKNLEWRKEWEMNNILQWTPPDILVNYFALGVSGFDKDGSPVFIIPFGNCDIRGLLKCCSTQELLRYINQITEKYLLYMRNKSAELNMPFVKQIFIVDLENFSFKDFTSKAVLRTAIQIVQSYDANYPETLKRGYFINAPPIFTTAFALIKPFIHEATLKKMRIFGQNGWKELLMQDIPCDQLPVHWGGAMTDDDGNTKCPSKICPGGKVPQEYYLKNRRSEINDETDKKLENFVIPENVEREIKQTLKQEGVETT